jgi:hypothetical protein
MSLQNPAEQGRSRRALANFRGAFHQCLPPWSDALFELTEAALCAPAPMGIGAVTPP